MPTPAARQSVAYVYLLTLVAALGGLLFGYDTAVISGAIGFLRVHFQLDPEVATGWAAASALLGCAVGAGLAGLAGDRLGRKKVLLLSAGLFFLSAVGTAFPATINQFVAFRIIGGIGIGAASISSPMYIAEISPARIRGRMVSVNQFAIISGMLVVYFVNYFVAAGGTAIDRRLAAERLEGRSAVLNDGFVSDFLVKRSPDIRANEAEERGKLSRKEIRDFIGRHHGQLEGQLVAAFLTEGGVPADPSSVEVASTGQEPWNEARGWRWMFGSGILPSVLFMVLLLLVPESPRWLMGRGREREAQAVLARVGGEEHARMELAEIRDAISQESPSLAQLFEPKMRIVLLIGVALAVLQQVTGINVFLYFAPEIFKKMGSGEHAALLEQVLVGAVNLAFTIVAIRTVDRVGRKPLMLGGAAGMGLCMLALGLAAYLEKTDVWVLLFILGYTACFALSVGPVVWVILSEIFPTKIRGRAMAIATVCLWVANYVVTQTFTMMNENSWLVEKYHHGFPFWIYGFLCGVTVLFVWRFVPETKGRTLEEIKRSWGR